MQSSSYSNGNPRVIIFPQKFGYSNQSSDSHFRMHILEWEELKWACLDDDLTFWLLPWTAMILSWISFRIAFLSNKHLCLLHLAKEWCFCCIKWSNLFLFKFFVFFKVWWTVKKLYHSLPQRQLDWVNSLFLYPISRTRDKLCLFFRVRKIIFIQICCYAMVVILLIHMLNQCGGM